VQYEIDEEFGLVDSSVYESRPCNEAVDFDELDGSARDYLKN
jgi:hypothetical protein